MVLSKQKIKCFTCGQPNPTPKENTFICLSCGAQNENIVTFKPAILNFEIEKIHNQKTVVKNKVEPYIFHCVNCQKPNKINTLTRETQCSFCQGLNTQKILIENTFPKGQLASSINNKFFLVEAERHGKLRVKDLFNRDEFFINLKSENFGKFGNNAAADISFNGNLLASSGLRRAEVFIIETEQWQLIKVINENIKGTVANLLFSNDENILAIQCYLISGLRIKSCIYFFETNNWTFIGKTIEITGFSPFCFTEACQQIVFFNDNKLYFHHIFKNKFFTQIFDAVGIKSISISQNNKYLSLSQANSKMVTLLSYKPSEPEPAKVYRELSYCEEEVNFAKFSPCGSFLFACSLGGKIQVWESLNFNPIYFFDSELNSYSIDFNGLGKYLAIANDKLNNLKIIPFEKYICDYCKIGNFLNLINVNTMKGFTCCICFKFQNYNATEKQLVLKVDRFLEDKNSYFKGSYSEKLKFLIKNAYILKDPISGEYISNDKKLNFVLIFSFLFLFLIFKF